LDAARALVRSPWQPIAIVGQLLVKEMAFVKIKQTSLAIVQH
jgi:hypothetical protein